ncbi:MAG: OmpA family protein [Nitrosomonadaceae bacterium]|nr:OmpA family protein [Nitrosomonadaceae bacterium]
MNFASNSATILKSDYNKLATIAKLVSGDGAENYGFRIEGHTDSSGSDAINDPLSLERATAVVSHLKKKYDISHYRLEAKGFGSRNPIISNSTKEGRSRNRRVEILLTKNLKNPTISVTTIPNTELMAVTPDKKFFIARGVRGAFNFWRIDDFVRLKTYKDFMPSGDHFTERIRPQFSPTGRYIAYAHSFKAFGSALVVFDSFSGRIVNQVALPDRIVEFAWSPFGDEIAIYLVGQLVKYRLDEKKVTSFKTLVENRGRRGLVWTDDGRYLALIQKGGVRIFDAQTLDDFDDLSVDFPHSLGLTHNGNYLICADNDRKLHVWDIRNNFKHRSMKIPVLGGRITSHPNKNKVLVNDWGGENKNQVILVDVNKMIIEAQSMVGDSNLYYEFIANGNQILQANHHTNIINVLNVKNLGVEKSFNGESNDAKGCIAFSDQGLLVTWDTEGFHIWDIATGKKIHVWKGTFEAFRDLSTLTKQGQFLALDKSSEDKATNVILFDVGTFARKVLLTLDFEVDLWGIDKGHLLFAGTPFMPLSEGSSKGIVQRYDLKSGALKGTIEVDMITEPLNSDSISMSAFSAITLSPDGDLVAVRTSWIDGWKTKRKYSQSTQVYSFKKGNKISQIDSVHEHLFFDSENRVCLSEKAFNPRNGSYLGKAGADISAVFWPFTTMNTEGKFLSRNLFVEVGKDNQVNLKNNTTKQLVLTIAVKRNNEWIAYAPSGEYVSSLNGTNKVYWLLGDKTLPFNAFKDKYDSPHIVKLKLEEISTNKKRIIKVTPKIDPEIFSSPYSVKLISQNNIEIQSGSYTLKLAVTKENANIPDPEFEYSLNGRVLKKSRGFDIVPVEKGPKTVKVEHLFELQGGLNIIEANIVYKGTNIHPQKVLITKTIENKLANNVQLWFFGVGVSTYEKTQQNLEFAHKDATKLGALLKAQEGKLFQKVNVLTMVNSEATEKNVRINMQRFLKKASSQDVIVIFLAGHGVQDNEQNLYFMTHDGTLDEPYTGMDLSKFESYLKSRPINQKVILMMDICHAGSMGLNGSRRGAITAEDAIKQLSEGTGTIVFASSTGKESSLEDVSYGGGHGAFTAALIEGLTGDADKKSGDQNNYVGILELMSYVSRRVPEITNGDQHPTTPQLINVRDFPLAEL